MGRKKVVPYKRPEKAPWETYNATFEEKLDPKMEEAIKRYSETAHANTSTQNAEELCRQKEMSNDLARQYQWVKPSEYQNTEARVGRIMHSSEFITRLRKLGGSKTRFFYRDHPQPRKLTLMVIRDGQVPEVGCWCQLGFTTEYEIMDFDDHGVPLDAKFRGYRTCLLQLILKGILSESAVEREFGKAVGPECGRYNETLYEWRNRRIEVV